MKLTLEQITFINALSNAGETPAEIAQVTGIPYSIVLNRTRWSRCPSISRLLDFKEKGLDSYTDYLNYRKEKARFDESNIDYLNYRAEKERFKSDTDYLKYLAEKAGFESYTDYLMHLAKQAGFESLTDYITHLVKQRTNRPENESLANLLTSRLEQLRIKQGELARKIGTNRMSVSRYCAGKQMPPSETYQKIMYALELFPMIPDS